MSNNEIISRRRFGSLLAASTVTAAGAALPAGQVHAAASGGSRLLHAARPARRIKPARLEQGDLVGIIAPGGFTDEPSIACAIDNIEALGLRVKLSDNLRAVHGSYAGSVQQRLDDLHAMFLDREVKALWAIRGGSGCISLLSAINYRLIEANPKILIGYSDITALHLAINRHAGLITFHGPVASSIFSPYSVTHLQAVLMAPQASYTIPMALENSRNAEESPHYAMRTVHAGQASGRLTGGNLCLVSALAGTPYAADFRNNILFLEEVGEAPYRIDRMMAQLQLSQGFEHAAALMLGIFEHCGAADDDMSLTLDETVDQHLLPLAIPAVTGYSFGHIRNQFTLPLGVMARLDTAQQTLTLLEPAVR